MATGLTISGTSNLSNGQKILVDNAMIAFEPAAPDPDLVMNRDAEPFKQYDLSTYARLSQASALIEGQDLSQVEQLVTTKISITPAEHGIIATLSKRLIRRQGDSDVVAVAGQELGASLRRRQANDIIALYTSFTAVTPGADSTLDITHFRASVAYLLTDNNSNYGPAPMPVHAALHIEQISDIILDVTDTTPRGTTTGFSDKLLQRWWKGSDRLYGVQVFHSGNISRDTASNASGAIFSPASMVLVRAGDVDPTEEPDNSARIIEYGIFQEWGESQRVDVHGVEILSDAATSITV